MKQMSPRKETHRTKVQESHHLYRSLRQTALMGYGKTIVASGYYINGVWF